MLFAERQLAVGHGPHVQVWKDVCREKQQAPYMKELIAGNDTLCYFVFVSSCLIRNCVACCNMRRCLSKCYSEDSMYWRVGREEAHT